MDYYPQERRWSYRFMDWIAGVLGDIGTVAFVLGQYVSFFITMIFALCTLQGVPGFGLGLIISGSITTVGILLVTIFFFWDRGKIKAQTIHKAAMRTQQILIDRLYKEKIEAVKEYENIIANLNRSMSDKEQQHDTLETELKNLNRDYDKLKDYVSEMIDYSDHIRNAISDL